MVFWLICNISNGLRGNQGGGVGYTVQPIPIKALGVIPRPNYDHAPLAEIICKIESSSSPDSIGRDSTGLL
jgi:hypothetical protein